MSDALVILAVTEQQGLDGGSTALADRKNDGLN